MYSENKLTNKISTLSNRLNFLKKEPNRNPGYKEFNKRGQKWTYKPKK